MFLFLLYVPVQRLDSLFSGGEKEQHTMCISKSQQILMGVNHLISNNTLIVHTAILVYTRIKQWCSKFSAISYSSTGFTMPVKYALWLLSQLCFVLQLKWPDSTTEVSSQVHTEGWWCSLEFLAIEAAVFKEVKLEPVLATEIVPWIPPMCRGPVQYNSEFQKKSSKAVLLVGCPKKLGGLIRTGQYNPLEVQKLSTEMLHDLCRSCTIPTQGLSKVHWVLDVIMVILVAIIVYIYSQSSENVDVITYLFIVMIVYIYNLSS